MMRVVPGVRIRRNGRARRAMLSCRVKDDGGLVNVGTVNEIPSSAGGLAVN